MTPSETKDEREQIQQAIAAQESLRGVLDDEVIDATITTLKEKLADLDSPLEKQRKLATILFMDIAGHTALTRDLDPEDQMALVDPLVSRLAEVVNQFGGHVARYQGDGFKAVFGLPIAQENDPEQAIRAGLAIQEVAAEISADLEAKYGLSDFKVRVGISTGLVFAGGETEGEDTIKGLPVNLAARLESTAKPGTVLISYDTYKFVRGIFNLELLKPIQVKGFPEPVQIYQVLEAKPRAFYRSMRVVEGVETRMIGREAELEILKDAFYTVFEEGQMQFITIVGEAGLGKSRLLYEFENWVDLQPEVVKFYRGRAHLETQRLPYDLLRSIFAFRFNIRDDDSREKVQEKWLSGFAQAGSDSSDAGISQSPKKRIDIEMRAHILGQLLGYDFSESPHLSRISGDARQLRDRSMVYLEDYFKAIASEQPVLIFLEDLHWTDDSSLDALSRLGLELRETSILIAGATRPGLYDRRPYWFEGRDFHRRVNLKPLSKRVNRQLVAEVLQKVQLIPDTLNDLIAINTEGNPFYVEELVKVLVEADVIVKTEPYWGVDVQRLKQLDVPSTLTGVLQARLERLPKDERVLIQQASVVGRVFWDQAIWYLNDQGGGVLENEGIQDGLVNLRGREIVYRRELSTFLDAQEYIFKHAMLREVIYESVLKKLRKVYHSLVAEWLMEQRGDRSGEVVGLIADHLELAGDQDEALRHLRWAGEAAAGKYANQEAIDYFSRALELVPEDDPETRFELLLAREEVLDLQAKREAQREDLYSLERLAKEMKSAEKQMEVGVRWSSYLWMISDYQAAAAIAEQVVTQAEAAGNTRFAATGQLRLGKALSRRDEYEKARQHLNQAYEGFQSLGDQRMAGKTLRMLGYVAGFLLDLSAWQDYSQQALAIARQIGDRSDEAEAINHLGNIAGQVGEYHSARRLFRRYLGIAKEIGSRDQERMALNNLGETELFLKNCPLALDYLEQSLVIARTTDNLWGEAHTLYALGKTLVSLEQWEAASQYYHKAMELFAEFGAEWGIAVSRTGLAQAALLQGDVEKGSSFVDQIMNYLGGGRIIDYSAGDRTESYLVCAKLLLAAGDSHARNVLEKGYAELQERAAKITDEALRRSFLENAPYNRELVKLWEEQQGENS